MQNGNRNRTNSYSKAVRINCRKPCTLIWVLCGCAAALGVISAIALRGYPDAGPEILFLARLFIYSAVLAGFLLVAPIYKELYDRQFADVEFSLPMNAAERYDAKIRVLILNHLLPVALASAVILAAVAVFQSNDANEMLIELVNNISAVLFTDSMAVLCVCCCGALAECIYTPVVLALSVSILPSAVINNLVVHMSGRDFGDRQFYTRYWGYDLENLLERQSKSLPVGYFVGIGLSLAVLFLCRHLYKKRDGLQTGTPFVFGAFFWVFTYTALAAVVIFFFMNDFYYGILFSMLGFFAVVLSSRRTTPTAGQLIRVLGGYAAGLVSVMLMGFISFLTGGFGIYSIDPVDRLAENGVLYVTINDNVKGDVYVIKGAALSEKYGDDVFYMYIRPDEDTFREVYRRAVSERDLGLSFGRLNDFLSQFYATVNYESTVSITGDAVLTVASDNFDSEHYSSGFDTDSMSFPIRSESIDELISWLDSKGITMIKTVENGEEVDFGEKGQDF